MFRILFLVGVLLALAAIPVYADCNGAGGVAYQQAVIQAVAVPQVAYVSAVPVVQQQVAYVQQVQAVYAQPVVQQVRVKKQFAIQQVRIKPQFQRQVIRTRIR